MNQKIPKVYLDTNIMIQGSKRPEHGKLIELALEGKFTLFIGDEASIELRQRTYDLRRIKEKLIREEEKYSQEQFMAELNRIIDKIKDSEEQTETELEFWREVKPQRVKNTFRGAMLQFCCAGGADEAPPRRV